MMEKGKKILYYILLLSRINNNPRGVAFTSQFDESLINYQEIIGFGVLIMTSKRK